MGRFEDIISSQDNSDEVVIKPNPRQPQAASIEEALEKNRLFSKNIYKEKELEKLPKPEPKQLNPGQSIFRHKLLEKPEASTVFVSKKSIRTTKPEEPAFVPVKYDNPPNFRYKKTVEEVAQDPSDIIEDVL